MSDLPGTEPLQLVRVVALLARYDDQRYPIALLGERTQASDEPGADEAGPAFRFLGAQVRAAMDDAGIDALQPYQDLELYGGTKEHDGFGISNGDEPLLIRTILRGIRKAYPTWMVTRVYRTSSDPEPARVTRIRREVDRTFSMLEALRDHGELTIDRSGRLGYHDNGRLSDWAEEEFGQLRGQMRNVVMPQTVSRHGISGRAHETRTVARAGGDDPVQDVIEALVERIDQISDPLGRLVLMDGLSTRLMPALYEQMAEAAAEFRSTVQPSTDETGTWVQIGEALGVTAARAQMRLDPTRWTRSADRSTGGAQEIAEPDAATSRVAP